MLESRLFEFADIPGLSEALEPLDRARSVKRHIHQNIKNRVNSKRGLMFGLSIFLPKESNTKHQDGLAILFRGAVSSSETNFLRGFVNDPDWSARMQIGFFESKNYFVNISYICRLFFDVINWLTKELLSDPHEDEIKEPYFNERLEQMLRGYRETHPTNFPIG